jgi:DNA-binding transcriptional LysR family regulator
VTTAIKDLEHTVGVALFSRTPHGTDLGRPAISLARL